MTMELDLPPELREVESALAARSKPEADSTVRARILAGVRAELAIRERSIPPSLWRYAAAWAALVLLWLNLSISAVNWTEFRLSPGESQFDEQTALAQIEGLVPDCTKAEARRQLLLLRASAQLICVPRLPRGGSDIDRDL